MRLTTALTSFRADFLEFVLAAAIAVTSVASAKDLPRTQASPTANDGTWEVTWRCDGGPCPSIEDHFDLELRTNGNQVCAKVAASANGGNKVDEDENGEPPSVVGRYEEGIVTVAYMSHWGGRGVASIQVEDGSLQWRVLWHDKGTSYIPLQAVLHKITEPRRPLWQVFDCPQ